MTPEQKARKKAYDAARYRANPTVRARVKAFSEAWAAANPEKKRISARKTARKRLGIVDPTGERRTGPCEICGRPSDPLHLDHDHSTGRIRGWLCYNCNRGIGHLQDSPIILRAAISYLETTCAKKT